MPAEGRRLAGPPCRMAAALLALTLLGARPAVADGSPAPAPLARAAPAPATAPADLQFADLFRRPVGPAGLEPGPRLLALAGQPVRLAGYVARLPGQAASTFVLAPYPGQLPDADDALADDLPAGIVFVHLAGGAVLPPGIAWLQVQGVLSVGPQDEVDGHVSHVRLNLDRTTTADLLAGLPAP